MLGHYVRRFFTSLSRRPPSPDDEAWAATVATPDEYALFARLSNQDRRHLIDSARRVQGALGPDADPVWLRAALLHDVGKYHAGLGVVERAVATVVAVGVGRSRVGAWSDRDRPAGSDRPLRAARRDRRRRAAGRRAARSRWPSGRRCTITGDEFATSAIPPDVLAVLDAADH